LLIGGGRGRVRGLCIEDIDGEHSAVDSRRSRERGLRIDGIGLRVAANSVDDVRSFPRVKLRCSARRVGDGALVSTTSFDRAAPFAGWFSLRSVRREFIFGFDDGLAGCSTVEDMNRAKFQLVFRFFKPCLPSGLPA
jgi:hypothetical protein